MSMETDNLHQHAAAVPVPKIVLGMELHPKVLEFTRGIFHSEVSIHQESDPEFPCEYFVVETMATGSVEHLVELHHQWHRGISDVVGLDADYRLSVSIE